MEDTKKTVRAIERGLRNFCWDFYGGRFRNPVLPKSPDSFLFLCKGNICRSPFAERLTRKVLQANGHTAIRICSAGLEVTRELPAPEEAILAAREFGVSLEDHRSQRIEPSMLQSFSMILVMEAGQLKVLKNFLLLFQSIWFFALFLPQIAFYGAAYWLHGSEKLTSHTILKIPLYFSTVNAAILIAWWKYLSGQRVVMWTPSER